MPETSASTKLPTKYTNRFVGYINNTSGIHLIVTGLFMYVGMVLICSIVMYGLATDGIDVLKKDATTVQDFPTIVYFNFVTIITVGYGDLAPVSWGRLIAVTEALTGIGLFGLIIGVAIIKATHQSVDSIVFSKYCYYAKDDERFFVVFVNTNKSPLVNAEMSYVLKAGEWSVRPSIMSPYVGKSVWTFFLGHLPREEIATLELKPDDGLKFGISGSYGFAQFSCHVKYSLQEILVLESRDVMTQMPILENPQFGSTELENCFHYRPSTAQNFVQYATSLRQMETSEG